MNSDEMRAARAWLRENTPDRGPARQAPQRLLDSLLGAQDGGLEEGPPADLGKQAVEDTAAEDAERAATASATAKKPTA